MDHNIDWEKHCQSKSDILFELPQKEDLNNSSKIKVFAYPPGIKDVEFDTEYPKYYCFEIGFQEINVGVAPERTRPLPNITHTKIKIWSKAQCN